MAHVIYMLVIFLMVKLVILVEIKGRWEKKKKQKKKGEERNFLSRVYIHHLSWAPLGG